MALLRPVIVNKLWPRCVVCGNGSALFSSTSKCNSSLSDADVKIPKRIRRSSTAILEALASTVSKDYTAPHYKFCDDPFLIPASNLSKRAFALSKESGKKAAKWIRDEYTLCFEDNPAQPTIKDFMPKTKYDESNATIENLQACVDGVEVTSAIKVYDILTSKGVQIPSDLKQSLLELLCYCNCQDALDEDLIEERWFRQSAVKDRNIWMTASKADEIFQNWDDKDGRAYSAMIRGLAKYLKVHQAWKLYEEMQQKQMPVDVETYNNLLLIVCFLQESSESRWQLALTLLTNMHREGVKPNLGTFNAVLEAITKLGSWQDSKKFALQVLAEMKQVNVEPSLGTYYYLLIIFYRPRGPVSTILFDIMNLIKNKEWKIQHPKDVFFFVTAMDVCHTHLQDKELAYHVHNLLHLKDNYALIGDSLKESIYYQHLFSLLCMEEDIDVFFEFYHKLVPNVYTPEPSVLLRIIEAVDVSGHLQYIPQIWSDIIIFEHTNRENVIEALLNVMGSNTSDKELQDKFMLVVSDIVQRVDTQNSLRQFGGLQWTGHMMGNAMVVYLNGGNYEEACKIFERCETEQNKISGPPKPEQLTHLAEEMINKNHLKRAISVIRYMANVGYASGANLAKTVLEMEDLNDKQKHELNEVISGVIGEVENS